MICFGRGTHFQVANVLLLNLALILCIETARSSHDLAFPGKEKYQQLSLGEGANGHRKHHRSENSPRLMAIDLSALSRSPLSIAVDAPAINAPPRLMGIDLSVLSRNPDPSLPLVQSAFPDTWDMSGRLMPVHRGLVMAPRGMPTLTEYDNMVVGGGNDVYRDATNREEKKKQAEPNTEDNEILIFPDTGYSGRSVPVHHRFPRLRSRGQANDDNGLGHRKATEIDSASNDSSSRLLSALLQNLIHADDSQLSSESDSKHQDEFRPISPSKSYYSETFDAE